MLKTFRVKNFKNFRDELVINFADRGDYQFNTDCIFDGIISKALIYGRNATGKTNLGSALLDASYTLSGRLRPYESSYYLNADSNESVAEFCYIMQFGSDEVTYRYTKSAQYTLQEEELLINGNTVFRVDFLKPELNPNLELIGAGDFSTQQYSKELNDNQTSEEDGGGQLSFFRWLVNSAAIANDSSIMKAANFLRRITVVNNRAYTGLSRLDSLFWESLTKEQALKSFEMFLNDMGIPGELVIKQMPDEQYQLFFKHNKLLPFQTASSGTKALTDIYRRVISSPSRFSILYFDEFDAFYHYEMADRLVQYFKTAFPQTQIILTTHNTNLLTNHLMRPDCYFILSQSGKLTSIRNATERELREGHNLEKMYISGEFAKYE